MKTLFFKYVEFLDRYCYLGKPEAIDYQLSYSETEIRLGVMQTGDTYIFHGFASETDLWLRGRMRQFVDAAGEVSNYGYAENGDLLAMSGGAGGATALFEYTYHDETPLLGLLEQVTLSIVSGTTTLLIARATYDYYEMSDPQGPPRALKHVLRERPDMYGNWTQTGEAYYTYYTDSLGLLHQALDSEAIARAQAAGVPLSSSAELLAPFADYTLEYLGGAVSKEIVQGGRFTHTFGYLRRPEPPPPMPPPHGLVWPRVINKWRQRTTERLPDLSTKTVYLNSAGMTMLEIFTSPAGEQWATGYRYNESSTRLIAKVQPSAIISWDEDSDELFTVTGQAVDLFTYDGTALTREYIGYMPPYRTLKRRTDFATRTVGGTTIYPVTSATEYQDASEAGARPATTEFEYTWFPDSLQMQQRITKWPIIPVEENGSGVQTSRIEIFNPAGQVLWLKDERGFISRFTYEPLTGARKQQIVDVDTALVTGVPAGWTTPADGGLHLITDYESDRWGRERVETGPPHVIASGETIRRTTWTVYPFDSWREEFRGSGSENHLVGPVEVIRRDWAGRVTDRIRAVRPPEQGTGPLLTYNFFPQSSWVRWSVTHYSDQSELNWQRRYHLIPSSGEGSEGVNYGEAQYGYDANGRQNRVRTPGGTITRTIYSALGWNLATWIGTDDNGATDDDPAGNGAAGNNMTRVVWNFFDHGLAGRDGNLTQSIACAGPDDLRLTLYGYDWRNRQVTSTGEEGLGFDFLYDNQDRQVRADQTFTKDSLRRLVARNQTHFDLLGRVFEKKRYAVEPEMGNIGNAISELTWYDPIGQVMKQRSREGGGFEKLSYDGAGRNIRRYVACDPDPETYAQADTVEGDTVLEQRHFTYDEASNLIQEDLCERNHNATGTGELHPNSGAEPKSRVSFMAYYSDELGRMVASANYGTNGGVAFTRPTEAPVSTNICLVTRTAYLPSGDLQSTIDPLGTVTLQTVDKGGRVVQTIENYHAVGSGADVNKTTDYGYNLDDKLTTLVARNSDTGDQTTEWRYGTTLSESGVASYNLLRKKIYPDGGQVAYAFNRLGGLVQQEDQNGTVHAWEYDKLGRLEHDRVVVLGEGIDGAVQRISRGYNALGLLETVTSSSSPIVGLGTVSSQVQLDYNGFGQLLYDYQAHGDVVFLESTPRVSYAYADGTNNSIRPLTITYPNGRNLTYEYGPEGSVDRLRGRIHEIKDADGSVLARYTHRGIKSTVRIEYVEPQVDLTYIKLAGEPVGDAGDQYTGLDRFGRIVDVRWLKTGTSDAVDRFKYFFDRASNRTFRENLTAPLVDWDESYYYDGLYQLKHLIRGNPEDIRWEEDFVFDPTGNWHHYEARSTLGVILSQDRTHNQANEITSITPTSPVAYDQAGNMTTMPKVGDWATGQQCTWDAWDRLVAISENGAPVGRYRYDGLTRRISKETFEDDLPQTRHFYYSDQWQVLEERMGVAMTQAERQFVWGLRYADDLILRDVHPAGSSASGIGGGGSPSTSSSSSSGLPLPARIYATHDQWHVTGLLTPAGEIAARLIYSAFGEWMIRDAGYNSYVVPLDWETGFGAYRYDAETGLNQVRYRYLHILLGRWLTRDPLIIRIGISPHLSLNDSVMSSESLDFSVVNGLQQTNMHGANVLASLGIERRLTSLVEIIAAQFESAEFAISKQAYDVPRKLLPSLREKLSLQVDSTVSLYKYIANRTTNSVDPDGLIIDFLKNHYVCKGIDRRTRIPLTVEKYSWKCDPKAAEKCCDQFGPSFDAYADLFEAVQTMTGTRVGINRMAYFLAKGGYLHCLKLAGL